MRLGMRDLERAFDAFCTAINIRRAKDHRDIGGLRLESSGSRYTVYQITNEGGGCRHFGPYEFYTLRELYERLMYTTRMLQDKQWFEDMSKDADLGQ